MRNAPHTIAISGSPAITDVDGVPEYQWLGLFDVAGRFDVLDVEESQVWASQEVIASVRVPLGTNIHPGARVTVNGEHYRVVTVRPNPMHLRAMLKEVT